jgi:hypothetical protein
MRISSAFPSNYLKASDLQGRQIKVTIDRVDTETIGNESKPILYFQGKEKGMVLNKTNANNIAAAFGDDTDDWAGAEIVLYEAMVDFQGKTVPALRIRIPPRKPVPAKRQDAPRESGGDPLNGRSAMYENEGPSDEIPF